MTFWPFKRWGEGNKSSSPSQARELRIATSGSFSIKALIELLRVDGAGSYSQPARVRAALFTPGSATTLQCCSTLFGGGRSGPAVPARVPGHHCPWPSRPRASAPPRALGGSTGWQAES